MKKDCGCEGKCSCGTGECQGIEDICKDPNMGARKAQEDDED